MLGVVLFEMNGGNPQKRNLINMLQSVALINLMILTCLLGACNVWRQVVGLIQFDTIKILEGAEMGNHQTYFTFHKQQVRYLFFFDFFLFNFTSDN